MATKNNTKIGFCYEYDEQGNLYHIEPGKDPNNNVVESKTQIANNTPIVKDLRVVDDGIETTEVIIITVLRDGKKSPDISVTAADIINQHPSIKFGAACRILNGRGNLSLYRDVIQIQCEQARKSTIYQHTGFILDDGKHVYLNGSCSVTGEGLSNDYNVSLPGDLTNYKFVNEQRENRFKTLLRDLPRVTTREIIYTGLGYVFLTPLNDLLRNGIKEPCFIWYLIGKTGSCKTTLAKLFLSFFGSFDMSTSAPANFRDTVNAIEKKFALTDCTLMLLDDRIPSTTRSIKEQMEKMEQTAARQIGDRAGRNRMTANGALRTTYVSKCNLIITAEDGYNNIGESGIARSISVKVDKSNIDFEMLTKVQDNATDLNSCMAEYIQYVINNWNELHGEMKTLFIKYRNNAQGIGHGRIAECVAHLQIGIYVMSKWLLSINEITEEEADQIAKEAEETYIKIAEEQNKRVTDEEPTKLFLEAVKELIARKEAKIIDLAQHPNGVTYPVDGYYDDTFYYFFPKEIYAKVRTYYDEQGQIFPLQRTTLFQRLADKNIILRGKELTRLKQINNKRIRYLHVYKDYLTEEVE